MSLRSKVLTIIALIVALSGVFSYAVQCKVISPSFTRLEREEAEKDLVRCIGAINREIQQLSMSAGDYGAWDDMATFVADGNQKFRDDNFSSSSLKNLGVNLVCICDTRGKVMALETLDLNTEDAIDIPDFPKDSFPATHILLQLSDPKDTIKGIVMTSMGPMLMASSPVLDNNRQGPVRGAVIMGRFLNEELVARLCEQAQVKFEILAASPSPSPVASDATLVTDLDKLPIQIDDNQPGVLNVTSTLSDITGGSLLPVKAVVPREITTKGRAAMLFANYSIIAIGLAVLIALFGSLQWTILGPMSRLTNHVVKVGKTDDLTKRLLMHGRDEIGTLATEFDQMVERLADARKKLVEQSYQCGIAEMASGTLHNVRNALTPVLVELDMLRSELSKVPIDQIDLAKRQLTEETVSDSRRQDLSKFLDLAGGHLVSLTRETHAKLDGVSVRARQIELFLSEQENLSRVDRPMEWVNLSDVTREAQSLLAANLRETFSIEMGSGLETLGSIKAQRICLMQVIHNLLTNAAEAIGQHCQSTGTVLVDASVDEVDDSPMVHLRIQDNGAGIAPENTDRIFERGFTTKGKTNRGLGLHWCANSVIEMGGRMYAESDGVGHGACLHVLFPKVA